MSPLKSVAAGVLFLLVAVAGLIYVVARPKPLVQALQPEALPATEVKTPEEVAEPTPEESPAEDVTQPAVVKLHTPQPKTFDVKLLSPLMAQTYVAPATVNLSATANYRSDLKSIEFYSGPFGLSVCRSLSNPEPFGTKIGEAISPPYNFTWNGVEPGNYNIIAVANYHTGEQQLSEPTVIVVNKTATYDGPEWTGWQPPYPDEMRAGQELALIPSPTPTPLLSECPVITVRSLGPPSGLKGAVRFDANISGTVPKDITYKWTVSAGRIVAGEETSSVTVDVDTILNIELVANLEVGALNAICPNTASSRISFVQPQWINATKRSLLLDLGWNLEGIIEAENKPAAQVYIFAQADSDTCVDSEVLGEARLARRYLIEVGGFKSDQIFIKNGGKLEPGLTHISNLELLLKSGTEDPDSLPDAIKLSAARKVRPCQSSMMMEVSYSSSRPLNRTCPDIADRIFYRTTLANYRKTINTCPYNPNDPINSETQVELVSGILEGTYATRPSFRYWSNGGKILNDGEKAIWDLSSLKLRPGVYTAITRANDTCDCVSSQATSVTVTNFCTPCITLSRSCDPEAPGQRQYFTANVETFALAREPTFQWTTSKGTIVAGHGSGKITVDTSKLTTGEKFEVTAKANGLMGYCVNRLSLEGIVGQCPVQEPVQIVASPMIGQTRRARRRPPDAELVKVGGSLSETELTNTTTPPENVEPKLNEKEWMSVSWSPRVKTDENFAVTVTYNRTTEAIEVTSGPGEISEELKLGGRFKSLKEKYGPEYEVFANARLVAAGIECNTCAQEQYQSLDRERVEWSWPVSPGGKGTRVFNVELWVKAEPRDKQSGRPEIATEKVWSRNNLKVEVAETILTRNNVLAGGSLCAVLGLGLCVRGLKIYRVGDTYNVGQAVAVGRNVTMNNTTVNQDAAKQDVQSGENK
ncbi:MAG TPA: Ig-like domain-containing protein [Pyrinomonadaceae bacterium]|nr:Ig-like domain-containing protein [Pyrinomonadaceae bacterium]